jgi:hypothetical protein
MFWSCLLWFITEAGWLVTWVVTPLGRSVLYFEFGDGPVRIFLAFTRILSHNNDLGVFAEEMKKKKSVGNSTFVQCFYLYQGLPDEPNQGCTPIPSNSDNVELGHWGHQTNINFTSVPFTAPSIYFVIPVINHRFFFRKRGGQQLKIAPIESIPDVAQ